MPIQKSHNLPWVSHNMVRKYPFEENCTLESESGAFVLPDDFIVGMQLTIGIVKPGETVTSNDFYSLTGFYLSRVRIGASGIGLTFSYCHDHGPNLNTSEPAFLTSVPLNPSANFIPGTPYLATGVGNFTNCYGSVSIGRVDSLFQQPPGSHTFDKTQTMIDPTVVKPSLIGITGVYVRDGGEVIGPITGDLTLSSGSNAVLSVTRSINSSNETQHYITINAIDPSGFNESDANQGSGTSYKTAIKSLNGVSPDATGNIDFISGNLCTVIDAQSQKAAHKILLSDFCSQPCCGCEQLEVITTELNALTKRAEGLENNIYLFASQLDTLDSTVLASRINTDGCIQCDKRDVP